MHTGLSQYSVVWFMLTSETTSQSESCSFGREAETDIDISNFGSKHGFSFFFPVYVSLYKFQQQCS